MPDWTGTRIQADALTVRCRHCGAEPGEPCRRGDGEVLRMFPAHTCRINDAERKANT